MENDRELFEVVSFYLSKEEDVAVRIIEVDGVDEVIISDGII